MISAIIFDMNGVITDDEHLHEDATLKAFEAFDILIDEKVYKEFCLGRADKEAFKDILNKLDVKGTDPDAIIEVKTELYKKIIGDNLKAYPHVIPFIKALSKKYPLAIATSSTFEEVQAVVQELKIKPCFKEIVSSSEVMRSKPDPESYLLAAEKLGIDPGNCLVIEDSVSGVRSAKSAGMKCIAITNTTDTEALKEADYIVSSYSEITDELIQKI